MKSKEELMKLAEEHWKYTEMIILDMLKLTEDLYKAGIIHGYKHGIEETEE